MGASVAGALAVDWVTGWAVDWVGGWVVEVAAVVDCKGRRQAPHAVQRLRGGGGLELGDCTQPPPPHCSTRVVCCTHPRVRLAGRAEPEPW